MTKEEHVLIVHMFARQSLTIKTLIEILKARNVIDDEDVSAFEASIFAEQDAMRNMVLSMASQYYSFAKALGLGDSVPPVD